MNLFSIIAVSVGLAMDAFAVSVCSGVKVRESKVKKALIMALYFGVFQGVMPLIGWFLGSKFAVYIESVDHWIAFGLLAIIGGKMLKEGLSNDDCDDSSDSEDAFSTKQLITLAIATSIDALAVGISFAVLDVNIYIAVLLIGIITFVISFLGVFLGSKLGEKFTNKAEILGGIILIVIGLRILVEHLMT